MGLTATLTLLVLALAVAGFANWQERRPRPLGNPPLVPYTAIQMVAVVVIILMLAHVVSLLSGQPLIGRLFR
jgi:uncharacterized membrane protein YidH (DUF202 family)